MATRPDLKEIGSSGLTEFSGYVYEEFLRELQGDRGRRVIRQMVDNDPVIGALLFAIEKLIRSIEWDVVKGSDGKEDEEAAEFISGCLFEDMSHSWEDVLSEILSFLPWGWSYFEIIYKYRQGDGDDPSRRSKFTDGRIGWRKWSIRAQETLSRWQFDESGGLQGMWQRDNAGGLSEVLIPIEKAIHFKADARKGNPEGRSILRNAYTSFYFKNNIQRIEGIGIERDLAGLPTMTVPHDWFTDGQYSTVFNQCKTIVTNIRRDEQEGVLLPQYIDPETKVPLIELKLLSTGGSRQFDTNAIIQRYDQRIAASVLADFILLGARSEGSFALSKDKTQLFTTAIGAWCKSIAGVINRHAIPRLLVLNGIKTPTPPMLQHGKVDSVDLGQLGEYIAKLSGAGAPLFPSPDGKLEHHVLDLAGLPAPAPETFVELEEERKEEAKAIQEGMAQQTPPQGEQIEEEGE